MIPSISPFDGRPVQLMDERAFYSGEHGRQVVRQLVEHAPAVRSAVAEHLNSRRAAGKERHKNEPTEAISFDDLFAHAGQARTGDPDIPAHLAITNADGSVEQFVLALRPLGGASALARSGGDTYVALDPDRFYGDEQELTVIDVTSSSTGEVVEASLIIDPADPDAYIEVSGDPDASVLVVEAIPVVSVDPAKPYFGDDEYGDSLLPPPPCDDEPVRLMGGCDDGGGGGTSGGTTPAPPTTTYLTLRVLRIADNHDTGSAEVQMHLQRQDNFDARYSAFNNRRFDFARFIDWEGYPNTPPDSPIFGPGNWNPVPLPALGILRWYDAVDVNSHDTDYDFTNRRVYDDHAYGDVPYIRADFQPADGWNEPGGMPLVPLTDDNAKWRGIMVEDDSRVDRLNRSEEVWSGNAHTFSFQTGQYASTNTRMRSGGSCGAFCNGDEIFTENAFRAANRDNVRNLSNGGSQPIPAMRGDWRFEFGMKTVTLSD